MTASITIPTILYIEVDNSAVTFDQPTEADFEVGEKAAQNQTVVIHRGNVPHSVTITAETPTFTASGSGWAAKPAEDLLWSIDGATWNSLTAADVKVVDGAPVGRDQKTVSYKVKLDYANDTPDTYTIEFKYTIVAD